MVDDCSVERIKATRVGKNGGVQKEKRNEEKTIKRDCEKKQRRGELKKESWRRETATREVAAVAQGMGPLEWR